MSFYNTNPVFGYTPQSVYSQVTTSSAQYVSPAPGTRPIYHQPSPYYSAVNSYPVNYRQPSVSCPYWVQGDINLPHNNPVFTPQSDHHHIEKTTVKDQCLPAKPPKSPVYYKVPTSPTDLFISKASGHAISVTPSQVSPRFNSGMKDSAHQESHQETQQPNLKFPEETSTSNASGQFSTSDSPNLSANNKNKNNSNVLNTVSNKTELFFERAWRLGIRCSKPKEELLFSPDAEKSTTLEKSPSPLDSLSSQSDVTIFKNKLASRDLITNPVMMKFNQFESQVILEEKKFIQSSALKFNMTSPKIADDNCSSAKTIKSEESDPENNKECSQTTSLNPNTPEFKPVCTEDSDRCLSSSLILPFQKIPLLPEDEDENEDDEENENSNNFCSTEESLYTGRNVDIIEMQPYLDELVDDQTQTDKVEFQDQEVATDERVTYLDELVDDQTQTDKLEVQDKEVATEGLMTHLDKLVDGQTQTDKVEFEDREVATDELVAYLDELVDDQTQTDKVELKDGEVTTDSVDTLSQSSQTDDWTPTPVKVKTKNRRSQTGPELMPPQAINLPPNINYAYMIALQREVYNLRGQMCLSELQRELHSLNYSKCHWSLFFQSQANTDTGLQELVDARMKCLQQCITNIEDLLRDGLVRLDNGENLKDLPDLSVYIPTVSGNTRYFPKSVMKDIDYKMHSSETATEEIAAEQKTVAPKRPGVEVSTQTDSLQEERRLPELILKEHERFSNAKKRKRDPKKHERKLSPTLLTIDEAPEMNESLEDNLSDKDVSIDSVQSSENSSCLEDPHPNQDVSITNSASNNHSHETVVIDFDVATESNLHMTSLDVELNVSDKDVDKKRSETEVQNEEAVRFLNEAVSLEKKDTPEFEKSKQNPSQLKTDVTYSNEEHWERSSSHVNQAMKTVQESKCDDTVLVQVPKANTYAHSVNRIEKMQKQETNCRSQNVPPFSEEKLKNDESVPRDTIPQRNDQTIQKAVSANETLVTDVNCQSHSLEIQNTCAQQSNGYVSKTSETKHMPIPQINQDIFRAVKTQLIRDFPHLLMNPVYLENLAMNQSFQLQNFIAMETNANTVRQQIPSQISPGTGLQQGQNGNQFPKQAISSSSVPPGLKEIKNNHQPQQQSSERHCNSDIDPSIQNPLFDGNVLTSRLPVKATVSQKTSENASVPRLPSAHPSTQDIPFQKNQNLPPRLFSQPPEVAVSQLPSSLMQYRLPFHRQPQKMPSQPLHLTAVHPYNVKSDQRSPSPKQLTIEDQATSITSQQILTHNSSGFKKDSEDPELKFNKSVAATSHSNIEHIQLPAEIVRPSAGIGKKPFIQEFTDLPQNNGTFICENNTKENENFLKNNDTSYIFETRKPTNSRSTISSKTSGTKKKSKKPAAPDVEPPSNPNSGAQEDWESEIDLFPETFKFKPESLNKPLDFGSSVGLDNFCIGELATSVSSSKKNRPPQTKVNKAFLGRLLQGADASYSRKSSTKPDADCDAHEKPVDTWQTVCKKKDKKASKTVSSTSEKSADTSRAKSQFEHLVQLLTEKIANVTRPDVLFAVSEIRKKRGSLKGMPMLVIIDSARTILKKKKSEPVTDVNATGQNRGLVAEVSPRFRQNVQKDLFPVVSVNDEGEVCVICCDELTMEKTKKLDCGHEFHINCIKEWVYKHERTCPTCRQIALFPEEFPHLK